MQIGDILYHRKHGKLIISDFKYSSIGNRTFFSAKDSSGKEHRLDGTEIPYAKHLLSVKKAEKSNVETSSAELEKKKRHEALVSSMESVKEAVSEGIEKVLSKEPVKVEQVKIPAFPQFPDEMKVNLPDLSSIEKKLDVLIRKEDVETRDMLAEAVSELKEQKTDKGVISAIENLAKVFPKEEDYSSVLREIADKVYPVLETVKIDGEQMKLLTKAIASIRGGGGSGGLVAVMNNNRDQINPATEETLLDVLDSILGCYAIRLDDTSTPNITYIGKAAIGSDTSDSVWQIKKIDETTGISITWADGDNLFNNVWDNRTIITYL